MEPPCFPERRGKDVVLLAETMARISATAPDFSLASDIIEESIWHIAEGISR